MLEKTIPCLQGAFVRGRHFFVIANEAVEGRIGEGGGSQDKF